jgi:hypothetical protein
MVWIFEIFRGIRTGVNPKNYFKPTHTIPLKNRFNLFFSRLFQTGLGI